MPGQWPHRKGAADQGKSFGSNDIQSMFTLLTVESSAGEHLVTETLGDVSPLNTTELVLRLDRPRPSPCRLTLTGASQPQVPAVPHLTYLSGWVNYYRQCLPQRLIIKRDSRGRREAEQHSWERWDENSPSAFMLQDLLSDVKITHTAVFLHCICSPLQRLLLCAQRCESGEGQVDKTSWWRRIFSLPNIRALQVAGHKSKLWLKKC